MKHLIKEPSLLEEGKHVGVIEKIEYRDAPFKYVDIYIKLDEVDFLLKYGCPQVVSENSKFGKLLNQIQKLVAGESIDDSILLNKKVSFMTIQEKTDSGNFARILDNTLKIIN